jgi:molecular chaperone GrpE
MSKKDKKEKIKKEIEKDSVEEKITLDSVEVERLRAQEKEAAGHLERLQRTQAEFENARKRLAREKSEYFLYAHEELIAKFLPVVDNFDRALEQAQDESHREAFIEGIRLIRKQLEGVLTESGLKPVESIGKTFDANQHEALAQVSSDAHPENTVVEEVQKGWFLHDRLLRPALVKISSGKQDNQQDKQ